MRDVIEVRYHEEGLLRLVGLSNEHHHGLLLVGAVDPLEAVRDVILLPERRMCPVDSIEIPYEVLDALVYRVLEEIPLELLVLGPLVILREVLAHEEKLLARMRPEVAIRGTKILRLLLEGLARHLPEHRALAVHDLVMREHEHEVLGVVIDHGEGELVIAALPEERIRTHVAEEVVHEAHVPLEVEAEAVLLDVTGDVRPCRGLLCDEQSARKALMELRVQMLQELHRIEVLVAAVDVPRCILALTTIVEVEHGGHGIHTDTIRMIAVCPEHRTADEEVRHLVLPVVEGQGAPVRVAREPWIRILIEARSIELCKPPAVAREVRRYPVEDDADASLMHVIHEVHEVLRCTVAARRSVVAGPLIAPARIERMLHHRHELNMRIALLLHIIRHLHRELTVIVELGAELRSAVLIDCLLLPCEGAEVQLIDRHRLFLDAGDAALRLLLLPCRIRPRKLSDVFHDGGIARTKLEAEGIRIDLQERLLVVTLDLILIEAARGEVRDEQLEHAGIAEALHHMAAAIPEVEVADDRNTLCVRCPYGERDTIDAVDPDRMRAHLLIDVIPDAALILLDITVGIGRREGIRVLGVLRRVVVIGDVVGIGRKCLVPGLLHRQEGREEAGLIDELHRIALSAEHELDRFCGRYEALHQQPLRDDVRTEDLLRVRGFRVGDVLHLRPVHDLF